MLSQDDGRKMRDGRHLLIHTDYQGPHNWRQYLRHVRCLSPTVAAASSAADQGDTQTRSTVDNTTTITTTTITTTKNNNNNKINTDRSHKESKKHSREEKQTETTASDKSRNTIPPWKKDLIEKKKKPFNPVNGVSEVFRRRAQMAKESPFTQQVVNTGPLSHGPSTLYRRRFSPSNSFRTQQTSGVYAYRRLLSQNISAYLTSNHELTRKRIEKVQRARLYLLQLTGPNSFLIGGDSPIHKFKVIIGPQTCSCGRSPHCVHVLFVMLRVFKVKETDPCLWSQTLKNYEVENLFRMYNDRRELLLVNKQSSKNIQKKQLEEKPENSPEKLSIRAESDAGSKDDEDTCPICLLEMLEGESLVRCMNGCHNRLHHHCITVWFEECHNQSPLICPICRTKWKNKIEENETGISQGEVSSPLIPDDLRLPYAEPVPVEYRDTARPWIQVLGEDLVCCLFSRNWSIREAALKYLSREMVSTLLRGSGEGRSGAMISSSQQTATHQMLECCCSVLAFMCADPVYRVFISCLRTLRALLSYTPCRDKQQRKRLQIILKPVIEAIIIKCTDGNKRTSQLSLSTMVELTKGQDGELAVGREIVSPGSGGLGGLAYILKLVLQEYQVKTVRWQWLLGRLYVLDRLLEEFPGEFIRDPEPDPDASEEELKSSPLPQPHTPESSSSTTTTTTATSSSSSPPPPTSSSSCPPSSSSSSSSSSQNEFCRIVIVARFATYAVGNAHSRIAKIARRIFFICVKFSAGQDEIVIQLDNLLVTAVDPKLMRPMRKKLSHMVDKIKQTEETANKVWHDSESSQGTSCVGTSATESPNETPLSTPPDSPFPLPTTLDSAANDPLSMTHPYISKDNHQDPPLPSFQNELQNNHQHSSCMGIVNDTGHELRHGLLNDAPNDLQIEPQHSSQNDLQYDPHLGSQHPHCSVNASCAKLQNVSVMCSVTLATSDHSGECKVEDISSITASNHSHNNTNTISTSSSCNNNSSSSNSNKQLVQNIMCTTRVNNCTDSPGDRSQFMVTMPSTSTPSSSMQHHHDDSNNSSVCHCSSTPLACSSSHSSSNILTEDLSDITVSPTGSNGPSVSFKTEIATPKGSPCGTEDQSKPDSYQYCCKEEVEREEAVALAKALEASAKQEPCPLVPGLTPSDREEVITVRIQPESQADMHPLASPFNHSNVLSSLPNSSSSSSSNNNNSNNNNNNSPLYLENVHWVRSNLLGTGAFSSCYQARDVKTGTLMAVKQISFCRNTEEEQEKVIQDVTEEIHMIAALNHPNVVRIMGATRQGCHFNMFVEWMPGGSVSNLLAKYGNFSETVVISYTHQVLRGLTYLHENQVLHRDLKGANLLVDSTGQRVRIGDFGAAARLATQTTQAGEFQGQLLGTIAFMAPEVLRGESYGRGCDVWSVGCVMIEMSTTKPPWNANDISNHLALIFRIASSVQPPPIPQKMSPGVRDIMLRCLEVKSEDRPPAKELLTHPVFMQHLNR